MYIKEEFGIFVIVIALFSFQILSGFDKFYNHYYSIHRHLTNIVYFDVLYEKEVQCMLINSTLKIEKRDKFDCFEMTENARINNWIDYIHQKKEKIYTKR